MKILQIDNLTAGYGKSIIINEVSIDVENGEIVGIVGPNGSGKSTLLKSICGLTTIFNGKIIFRGIDITRYKTDMLIRLGIVYVPQLDNIFSELTVVENLEMGIISLNIKSDLNDRIEEMFNIFPILKMRRNERAVTLSGGERQMLAIARALMSRPQLLLLDEPAASLSPKVANEIFEKLQEINRMGSTLLVVEQNVHRVLSVSNRGYVLVSGQKVLEGDSKTLLSMDLGSVFLGVAAKMPKNI
jgi:ABC-type branched-subunit amino acid transport system ATPase component